MALKITEDCINCGGCQSECPNGAIYESGEKWRFSDSTNLEGFIKNLNNVIVDTDEYNESLSNDFYYIVQDKCTECHLYSKEPECIAICPVDAFKESIVESEKDLEEKINWLFGKKYPYDSCPVYFIKTDEKSSSCKC